MRHGRVHAKLGVSCVFCSFRSVLAAETLEVNKQGSAWHLLTTGGCLLSKIIFPFSVGQQQQQQLQQQEQWANERTPFHLDPFGSMMIYCMALGLVDSVMRLSMGRWWNMYISPYCTYGLRFLAHCWLARQSRKFIIFSINFSSFLFFAKFSFILDLWHRGRR